MWYWAYASNMNRRQMEQRLQRVGLCWMIWRLNDYRLRFNKKSGVDQSGKANIVPHKERRCGVSSSSSLRKRLRA
jgi:hypothetical protein